MLSTFAAWTAGTGLSSLVMDSTWLWPAAEILHFIGLSLLVGITGLFDLRLIGWFRGIPVAALHRMMPWAIAGFAINLATGVVFFAGKPLQYAGNPAFVYKLLFLALAGLNAAVFEVLVARRALAAGPGEQVPPLGRAIGALSLLSWLGVLYWGRMLAFVGAAF